MRLFNIRSIFLIIILILSTALYFFTEAKYAALLLVLLLLIIILALITANLTGRDLKVSMDTPVQGVQGVPAHVAIKVENRGFFPVFMCKVKTVMTNLLMDEKDESTDCLSIGRKKTSNADFAVTESRCGCIQIDLDEIRVSDPLGLINVKPKKVEVETSGSRIYYMPKASETPIPTENLASYDMESYKYSPHKSGGDPSEIFDIREYQQHDNMKAIHWKLTGKIDTPMVKEFGLPIENKLMVIIDKSKAPAAAGDGASGAAGEVASETGEVGIGDAAAAASEVADAKGVRGKLKALKKAKAKTLVSALSDADLEKIEADTDFVSSLSLTLLNNNINHTLGWFNYLEEEFESYVVDDEASLWIAIKALISCPVREDGISAAAHYIESDTHKDFSNYIYVTDTGTDMERLMSYGAVSLYDPKDFR